MALGEGHSRGIGVANDEDVVQAGGEGLAVSVAHGDNVERSRVLLDEGNGTHAASVTSTGDHGQLAKLELNKINHLAGGDVNLDNVVHLHEGVGVSKGAAIVCHNKGDLLLGDLLSLDLAKLILLLLIADAVKHVALLGVIDQAELVAGLGDLDDIHETGREVGIGADLAIDHDVLVLADHVGLLASQSVLKSVSEHDNQRQGLSELVRTLGRARGLIYRANCSERGVSDEELGRFTDNNHETYPDAVHLGKHPVLGSIQSLQVLLRTSGLHKTERN